MLGQAGMVGPVGLAGGGAAAMKPIGDVAPSWFPSWLADNPYFSAGFGLVGVGAIVAALRSTAHGVAVAGRRFLFTSLEVPSKDYSYQWVMQWLVENQRTTTYHLGVETSYSKDSSGRATTSFAFIPSPGTHYTNYKGYYIKIDRTRQEGGMMDFTSGTPWETLTLSTLSLNKSLFLDLLEEAKQKALDAEEGKTIIYHSFGQEWRPFGSPKRIRPFDSVILDGEVAGVLDTDVKEFLGSSSWYIDRGIPYRRGYLLWGPPGCGKSSFVMALAGNLKYNICVMNVADPLLTDDRLNYLLATGH
eukprot:Platyproteum_vivax@DN7036_c0_g1_i4.p1